MGFRFWRRLKILPGVTLNLSKTGASVSFGRRGARLTFGPGGARGTVGIPGTGLFYTTKLSKRKTEGVRRPGLPASAAADEALVAHVDSLAVAPEDRPFIAGVRAFVAGDEEAAFTQLRAAPGDADAAFLAGVLALKRGDAATAAAALKQASDAPALGATFHKYHLALEVSIPVAESVHAAVAPDRRGALLGLVEAYQREGRTADAIAALRSLLALVPDDIVVKLSLAELLMATEDRAAWEEVVRLAGAATGETTVGAALLLFKAQALRHLGLFAAARDAARAALRRKAGRPPELLHAARYELAAALDASGDKKRARAEWEKLYAEAPDYEDVKERLGLAT